MVVSGSFDVIGISETELPGRVQVESPRGSSSRIGRKCRKSSCLSLS
jgi:hypothetical protein